MYQTKEMYPGCLYLLEGEAAAASCFLQTEADIQSFMRLAYRKLKDFLKIHEYNLTKDSWMMIVSIRSRKKILKSYHKQRERSKTCDRKNDHTSIWKIISEQIRQFLHEYVKGLNKRSGRQGSLVKQSYKRSYFGSLEEAKAHIDGLRKQIIKREQQLKKYRGRKKFYKIKKKTQKGHIFLCTNWKDLGKNVEKRFGKIGVDMKAIFEFENLMTQRFVSKTLNTHSSG